MQSKVKKREATKLNEYIYRHICIKCQISIIFILIYTCVQLFLLQYVYRTQVYNIYACYCVI
jgi:hypothetical protein